MPGHPTLAEIAELKRLSRRVQDGQVVLRPATDLEDEFETLGRNTSTKCEATFVTIVAARTDDPVLIAAAERGRRQVLDTLRRTSHPRTGGPS
jgi:hypothetical protein